MFDNELSKFLSECKVSQLELAKKLNVSRQFISMCASGKKLFPNNKKELLYSLYPEYFGDKKIASLYAKLDNPNNTNLVAIKYRPEVELSAGYGSYALSEECETVYIDNKLLISNKGLSINPKFCEIVKVSGDSMLPEYQDGDRVVIDKSINQFIDGHIFAFRYEDQCFIKRINVLPDKIKCIPLNEAYDTFYIDKSSNYNILGLILPRIRF